MAIMDVRYAVRRAKEHIGELFADEHIINVGLEEVSFDEESTSWNVTIGFDRDWERKDAQPHSIFRPAPQRAYKMVTMIDGTGEITSMKDRVVDLSR